MNKYSTSTEVIAGEWIDGSPIYRKTIDFGALPSSDRKTVEIGTTIKQLIKLEAMAYRSSDGTNMPIPFVSSQSGGDSRSIQIETTKTTITVHTIVDRSDLTAYITLYYIK